MAGNGKIDWSNVPYTSSSDSSDDDDADIEAKENAIQEHNLPSIPEEKNSKEVVNEEQKIIDVQQNKERDILLKRLAFYELEVSRLNALLSATFDPEKRRRNVYQYGCRTCNRFPKKTACICVKNKTKKIKTN